MLRLPMAFACVAVVLASQASLAGGPERMVFSRANTTFEQFRLDQEDCTAKSTKMVQTMSAPMSSTRTAPPICAAGMGPQPICTSSGVWPSPQPPPALNISYKHNNAEFLQCMLARGYQERPTASPSGSVAQ